MDFESALAAVGPPTEDSLSNDKDDDEAFEHLVETSGSMSLEQLLDHTVYPNEARQSEMEWSFEGLANWGSVGASKDSPPLRLVSKLAIDYINGEISGDAKEGSGKKKPKRKKKSIKQRLKDFIKKQIRKRIHKWIRRFIKKLVKTVLRKAAKILFRSLRWVLRTAFRFVIDFVVRPVLMASLEFIGLNPELWPFIAALGGAVAVGVFVWKKFFKNTDDSKVAEAEDKGAETFSADKPAPAPSTKPAPAPSTKPATTSVKSEVDRNRPHRSADEQTPTGTAAPKPKGQPEAAGAPLSNDGVKAMIKRHEGSGRPGHPGEPYQDSLGLWTIGYGHLIGDGHSLPSEWNRKLSQPEMDDLFEKDYPGYAAAAAKMPNFDKLNAQGQGAFIDISYNMGKGWWHSWTHLIQQMKDFDIQGVIDNLRGSKWAGQVKGRAVEDLALLQTNVGNTTNSGDTASIKKSVTTQPPVRAASNGAQPTPATGTATGGSVKPTERQIVMVGGKPTAIGT